MDGLLNLWHATGIANFTFPALIMIAVGCLLLYLAIARNFEPLLLLPIGFGAILTNIPVAGLSDPGGLLYYVYHIGIDSGVFPLLIFMGVGALTDFSALIANPRMLLLGAAAQFGIFATLFGAILLNFIPGFEFTLQDASAIAIIGGADGPTAIFLASKLAPDLLGAIAVAAYSYMALVPIIQPPIMRALTTPEERQIQMPQLRAVSKTEKIIFPLMVLSLTILFLPAATPLVGMFCLGNLTFECGVVDRLSNSAQNEIINITTIFLGLAVGSKLAADKFLTVETIGILVLGALASAIGTASGVFMAKANAPSTKIPIVSTVKNLSAASFEPTARPKKIVVMLMISFCALLLKRSTTPHSNVKLPKQNMPTRGVAAGKNKIVRLNTISGKIIFSVFDTARNCGI
jgi:oxaloacetate decarboxylase beta subunit